MCIYSADSLARNIHNWKTISASEYVQRIILEGVRVPFSSKPESFILRNRIIGLRESSFITEQVNTLSKRGYISKTPDRPFCVSPISCVPKKGGKLRLITDLRVLNGHCSAPKFSNEGIDNVANIIQPNDCMVTLDIKNGFFHIPIHTDFRTYFGFQWQGAFYVWKVLPFGWNCSPYFFSKTLRPVVSYLRLCNIRMSLFVDDFLICAESSKIQDHKYTVIQTLLKLGLHINWDKSEFVPSTSRLYIGFRIITDTKEGIPIIKVPGDRMRKLRRLIRNTLSKGYTTARGLAKITGLCISVTKAVLPGKLLLCNAYRLVASRCNWDSTLVLDPPTIKDLTWWIQATRSWNGAPLLCKPVDIEMTTDASHVGWGATIPGLSAMGQWSRKWSHLHSNARELMAVLLAIHAFLTHLKGKHIRILTDNISTVAYLNHLGGSSNMLNQIATSVWATAFQHNIQISARHLPGTLNIEADALSRYESPYEWQIHPVIFQYIDKLWGPHTFDRFASLTNRQLPLYNSLLHDPETSGIDALAQKNWNQHLNWVNPPFFILGKVIDLIIQQNAQATIIAPLWPAQPWFHKLKRLLIAPPIRLPNHHNVFRSANPDINPEPRKNWRWKIYAWRVYGGINCHAKVGPKERSDNSH